jgi:hypothetical protein
LMVNIDIHHCIVDHPYHPQMVLEEIELQQQIIHLIFNSKYSLNVNLSKT